MLNSFSLWLTDRSIQIKLQECNTFLHESLKPFSSQPIPELKQSSVVTSLSPQELKQKLIDLTITAIEKEIQDKRSVNNFSIMLLNTIRHQFMNYDRVRDAISAKRRAGVLPKCDEVKILKELITKLHEIIKSFINKISITPEPTKENPNPKPTGFSAKVNNKIFLSNPTQLHIANDDELGHELRQLNVQDKQHCKDQQETTPEPIKEPEPMLPPKNIIPNLKMNAMRRL
jgi:hypothetical protein